MGILQNFTNLFDLFWSSKSKVIKENRKRKKRGNRPNRANTGPAAPSLFSPLFLPGGPAQREAPSFFFPNGLISWPNFPFPFFYFSLFVAEPNFWPIRPKILFLYVKAPLFSPTLPIYKSLTPPLAYIMPPWVWSKSKIIFRSNHLFWSD